MDQLFWMVREKKYICCPFASCVDQAKGYYTGIIQAILVTWPASLYVPFSPFYFFPKYFLFRRTAIALQIPSLSCSLLFHCPWTCWLHTLLQIFGMTYLLAISSVKTSTHFFISSIPLFMSAIFLMALHIPLSHLHTLCCLVACAACWNSSDRCLF